MANVNPLTKAGIALLIILTFLFNFGCSPEKIINDKNYTISIHLKSSLSGKKIPDGTELQLYVKSKNLNLQTYSNNGSAEFIYHAPENSTQELILTVAETLGYDSLRYGFSTTGDKSLELTLTAKTQTCLISINTTSENLPVGNIAFTIMPGDITGTTDANGNETISFLLKTNEYNEPQNTNATFEFKESPTTKQMHYDRTIIPEKENNFTFELTKQTYQHTFTIKTTSNIEGKKPLLTNAKGTIKYDNKTTNFNPETGIVNFVSDNEIEEEIIVNVSNVPSHKNGEITINNIGSRTKNNEEHNITLEGLIYDATKPINITNEEGTTITEANIKYEIGTTTGEQTTNNEGKTTITINKLETDTNNIPLEEYSLKITTTKKGYQEKTTNINITTGTNKEETITIKPNEYWIKGTVTPEGTNIKGWKEGKIIFNTTGGEYTTDTIKSTTEPYTLDSITFKKEGYEPQKFVNVTLKPNEENTKNANLEQKTYTTHIQGKVLDLTKERVRNRSNALVITNATGVNHYFSLDANGEFSGDITTNDPNETVTAYWNETTMEEYDKNTISFNKDNEPYPINRVIAGDYKPYDETSLVSIDVSKLDDDYLRVYAGKDEIVNNDTLKFAINGYGIGSFNYGRTEPMRPYVYTLLPDGTTISTTDEERMNHVIEQARNIFYDTETGWAIPINQRESGTDPGTRSGRWLMRQIPQQGYWNGGYMIIGETNLLEGGEAQIDRPVDPNRSYREIIGPWIRDGPDGENIYAYTTDNNNTPDNFNDDTYTLTTLGKAHITITTDFPAGSGKE